MSVDLNAEYCCTCKGWTCADGLYSYDGGRGLRRASALPDYLSDDGELGRMVLALYPDGYTSITKNIVDWRAAKNALFPKRGFPPVRVAAYTFREAAMRACIALKLQVPDAGAAR